jgi:hypothetical protein
MVCRARTLASTDPPARTPSLRRLAVGTTWPLMEDLRLIVRESYTKISQKSVVS